MSSHSSGLIFYAILFVLPTYLVNSFPTSNCLRCSSTIRSISPLFASSKFNGYQQPLTKSKAFEYAQNLSTSSSPSPIIILVNPFLDQNIGSVARTMLNFGLSELRIVNPVCDLNSPNIEACASGAYEIIQHAQVFTSLSECLKDLTYVFATTDRARHMTQMIYTPRKAAVKAVQVQLEHTGDRTGIMFGRERNGLDNEELAMAHGVITIPTQQHFSSLNLAQAVNLIAYECFIQRNTINNSVPPDQWLHPKDNDRLLRREELDNFFERFEKLLDERNMQRDPIRKKYVYRNIRNIFQRVMMTKSEVDTLHGALTTLIHPPITQPHELPSSDKINSEQHSEI